MVPLNVPIGWNGVDAGDWYFQTIDNLDDLFLVGGDISNGAESFEIAVSDGYAWSEWYTINITTGANALPALTVTDPNLELGTWTKLSDIVSANDADGDSKESVSASGGAGSGMFNVYSVSNNGYIYAFDGVDMDDPSSYDQTGFLLPRVFDLPSLDDVYIKSYDGYYHSDSFNLSLSDGYSWSDTTTVDIEFGTNTLNSGINDGNTISGTLNGTIRTNEQRALSEYISYYDDPNDDTDDYSAYGGIKIRTSGTTSLGIGYESGIVF